MFNIKKYFLLGTAILISITSLITHAQDNIKNVSFTIYSAFYSPPTYLNTNYIYTNNKKFGYNLGTELVFNGKKYLNYGVGLTFTNINIGKASTSEANQKNDVCAYELFGYNVEAYFKTELFLYTFKKFATFNALYADVGIGSSIALIHDNTTTYTNNNQIAFNPLVYGALNFAFSEFYISVGYNYNIIKKEFSKKFSDSATAEHLKVPKANYAINNNHFFFKIARNF